MKSKPVSFPSVRRSRAFDVLALAVALIFAVSAKAQILFSTDGQTNPAINGSTNYYWGNDPANGVGGLYMRFTAQQSGLVGSAVFPLLKDSGPGSVQLTLHTDASNQVGSQVLSFTQGATLPTDAFSYITFSAASSYNLVAGNTYWVGLSSATTDYRWANNGSNNASTAFIASNGAEFGGNAGSFSVSAIPEPSTYAAIFGAAALGVAVWRRQQPRAKAFA